MRHLPHRPPWWPANEPWPPHRPPGPMIGGRMRGRFLWRMAGLFVFFMLFAGGGCALASALALAGARALKIPPGGEPFLAFSGFVIVIVGVTLVGRLLARATMPVGDVMEAAGRVAEGDYGARVAERGPREVHSLARSFNAMAERLQLNDDQRRNLMADVAHELRTPLTVIQGNLEGLLDGVYPRDDAHLAPILEETRVLARLIEDLRTLALAEAGALPLHREPTDLAELIREAVASFRAQADAGSVSLRVELAVNLPTLEADPDRLRQVLTNLIANAISYTPRAGTITVGCAASAEGGVTVTVHDTGPGISPADLPHVFDRFYKSRDSGGSGLGLAIARSLVNAHGGQIRAESEAGEGTTIRFTLPLGPAI